MIESGANPKRAAAEHGSEPAEAADHLVGDHVDIVSAADFHDLLEIVAGGTITPPAPITGSAMKAADGVGPFALDHVHRARRRAGVAKSSSLSPACAKR